MMFFAIFARIVAMIADTISFPSRSASLLLFPLVVIFSHLLRKFTKKREKTTSARYIRCVYGWRYFINYERMLRLGLYSGFEMPIILPYYVVYLLTCVFLLFHDNRVRVLRFSFFLNPLLFVNGILYQIFHTHINHSKFAILYISVMPLSPHHFFPLFCFVVCVCHFSRPPSAPCFIHLVFFFFLHLSCWCW